MYHYYRNRTFLHFYVQFRNMLREMIPLIPKFFLTGRTDQKSHRITDAILSFIHELFLYLWLFQILIVELRKLVEWDCVLVTAVVKIGMGSPLNNEKLLVIGVFAVPGHILKCILAEIE